MVGQHRSEAASEYAAVAGAGVAAIVAGAGDSRRRSGASCRRSRSGLRGTGMAGVAATGAGLAPPHVLPRG